MEELLFSRPCQHLFCFFYKLHPYYSASRNQCPKCAICAVHGRLQKQVFVQLFRSATTELYDSMCLVVNIHQDALTGNWDALTDK